VKASGPEGAWPADRLEKRLRRVGTLALVAGMLMVPAFYVFFSLTARTSALNAEATYLGLAVERIIHDRPQLWEYETLRMREITDRVGQAGAESRRSIRTVDGRLLAENGHQPQGPSLRVAVPIHDSGRWVATFEAERSCRDLVWNAAGGTVLALGLALLASWSLRAFPMRFSAALRAQLSSERRRSETILEALQEGVVALDDQGRILQVNPVAVQLLGSSGGAVDPDRVRHLLEGLARTGDGFPQGRVAVETAKGPARTLEVRGFPIPLPGTEAPGQVVLFRDITENLQLEAEERRARQLESLGILAGGIAHDFNNFLTAIQGNVSLAKIQAGHDPRMLEYLERALQSTRRAHGVSNRLLTFAKGGEPARAVMDLPAVIQEATGFALQGSGVEFTFDFEPGLARIEGDASQISQVFLNLAINAMQAMDGHGSLQIQGLNQWIGKGQVPGLDAGPHVRVHVLDSGPGIPASILDRIFEPYFTTKTAGSGLGLASAYRIVRAHGGNIFAGREEPGGACFTLYFPACSSVVVEDPAPVQTVRPGSGARILVMDDDPLIQAACQGILEYHGHSVTVVSEGQQAAEAYHAASVAGDPFQVVILDLTIPGGIGGKEAAEIILREHPEACLVASSGYNDDPVMAAPTSFGFSAALPKPYAESDLARTLAPLLARVTDQRGRPVV